MQARNFIIIINPVSGTEDKKPARAYIEQTLTQKKISYQFLTAEPTGEYGYLKAKIAADNITDIIICGGDGTVNQVAARLLGTNVRLGIIPMGSGNGLAFAAGIPKDYKKALKIVLEGNADLTDAFLINNKFSCMLCGLGFDAYVAREFAAQPARGLVTYIRESVKHFFKAEPYPFQIKANGAEINTEAFFISIANSNQFGNNFTIAPKASLSDGLLDIVIVNKTGRLNLILKLLKQIRKGKIVNANDPQQTVHYFQTNKMSIANPANAPLHIDGDIADTAEYFEIEIVPKAFLLIQPARSVK